MTISEHQRYIPIFLTFLFVSLMIVFYLKTNFAILAIQFVFKRYLINMSCGVFKLCGSFSESVMSSCDMLLCETILFIKLYAYVCFYVFPIIELCYVYVAFVYWFYG